MGYAVLPMAIALDTLVAVGPITKASITDGVVREDGLWIGNVEDKKFDEVSCPADPMLTVQRKEHGWAGYVLCAYKGW